MTTPPTPLARRFRHWLEDRATGAVIGVMRLIPYRWRIPAMGWFSRTVLGPLAMNKRIRNNLHHIFPELPPAEVRRICREVADNFACLMIEIHSGAEFARFAATQPISGPGLPALDEAHSSGRPVILVSAHFGNYDAWRAGLSARGFNVGGLYKPLTNPAANRRYVATIESVAKPLFPRGSEGLADMIRFVRAGGMLGILGDQNFNSGEVLDFLGKPALTAISAAKMALKYNALMVPVYATRNPDGLSFTIEVETPIPHTDAITMTQALNDSTAARVRGHMGQWFWIHRRWKYVPKSE
ncbi:lauroyl acyltransferase [Pararhodobacter sp.]|uniref:lysophospholipid acyltransferase family protein n=1 Tax=Pararhodobacter sp. TaxID=2127056 RepID=UPI002AFFD887|nr:lauroyl acyltransferase [Pararhodobacter sp.]